MKINKILMGLGAVAALSLGACSNDEPANAPDNNLSDGEPRYMAVTITTASDLSRAEGDEEATPNKDYEHGLEAESKINTVSLYFFDVEGNPAKVKGNSNAYTITKDDLVELGQDGVNVSNCTKAVIVIHTPEDNAIPAQIVAIVNKGNESYAGKSIAQLQGLIVDAETQKMLATDGQNDDGFVMTNSVYVAGNALHIGAEVSGHLYNNKDDAKKDPVTIYVERTLAKVRLTSNIKTIVTLSDGTKAYDPNKEDKEEKFGDKQIYVKFLGWNTTAKSTQNRLVKVIDPLWNAGWSWYDAYRFRSFWAMNAEGNEYDYFSFEGAENTADGKKAFDGTDYTYLKENAAVGEDDLNPTTRSKVIIAAQLVDNEGNAIEMAEYGGIRMSVEGLKTAFANSLSLYYKQENKDVDDNVYHVYTKISPNEIKLITTTQGQDALTDADKEAGVTYGSKRYLVYATLTDDAAKKVWYAQTLNNDDLNPALTSTEVKKALIALGGAKVWKDGKTYYYFDIRHLGYDVPTAEFGQYGVVRNHVYDAGLSTLVGLGTPVYRPEEVIIPERPSNDETFIAAEIKVLSWRVVNNNIDLKW